MVRSLFSLFILGFFFCVVLWGVNTSLVRFNKQVLPAEPIRILSITEKDYGIVDIKIMKETIEVNTTAIKERGLKVLAMGKRRWESAKSNPRLNESIKRVKELARDRWKLWLNSEEVKAVNGWVKKKFLISKFFPPTS